MYTLTNVNSIIRDADGAYIPIDPANGDYQKYLEWVDLGNTPTPAPPISNVPKLISAYQAKLSLLQANLYQQTEILVLSSEDPSLSIAWNNAPYFRRNHPFILTLGTELGLSNTDIDDLFIAAAQIE